MMDPKRLPIVFAAVLAADQEASKLRGVAGAGFIVLGIWPLARA